MSSIIEVLKKRKMISYLSIVELKLRFTGTVLGFLWSVLEPLIQLLIMYVIFTAIRAREEDFMIYLFSGLIMVHLFSRGTTQGMNSLFSKKSIIISINIPKAVFPFSVILTNIYMFLIDIAIFFMFVVILDFKLSLTIIFLPLIYGLLIVLITGISLLLSVTRIFFTDIRAIWGIVTLSLIFITPVFWRLETIPSELARILLLNPLALLMTMSRDVIMFNTIPSNQVFLYAIISCFVILFIGWEVFSKLEKRIVENL